MIIATLPTPYNGQTHVRLVNINLDGSPTSVAHFRLGHFEGAAPSMPYSAEDAPEGWVESAELNTADLPFGILSLTQVVEAINTQLQEHA
jgi:hypothetical protein